MRTRVARRRPARPLRPRVAGRPRVVITVPEGTFDLGRRSTSATSSGRWKRRWRRRPPPCARWRPRQREWTRAQRGGDPRAPAPSSSSRRRPSAWKRSGRGARPSATCARAWLPPHPSPPSAARRAGRDRAARPSGGPRGARLRRALLHRGSPVPAGAAGRASPVALLVRRHRRTPACPRSRTATDADAVVTAVRERVVAGLETYRRPLASLRPEDFVTVAVDLVPDVSCARGRRGTLLVRVRAGDLQDRGAGRLSAAELPQARRVRGELAPQEDRGEHGQAAVGDGEEQEAARRAVLEVVEHEERPRPGPWRARPRPTGSRGAPPRRARPRSSRRPATSVNTPLSCALMRGTGGGAPISRASCGATSSIGTASARS